MSRIVVAGAGQPGAVEVKTAGWIEIHRLHDQTLVNILLLELNRGEAEALALATEIKADLLLVDESKGRAIAARLGFKHIGLLGVLVQAKQRGIIVAVKPILDDLIAKAGCWIGAELYQRVLQAVSE